MKISFIVPVYQAQDYISQCVESILSQTFGEIELILVHTETGDASGAICDEYAKNDTRVLVVHEQTSISGARNIGLKLATGDYIAFVDADDWLEASCCEMIFNDIRISDGADIILFDAYYNTREKQITLRMFREDFFVWQREQIEILVLDLLSGKYDQNFCDKGVNTFTTVWGRFFKRELIRELTSPEIGRAEDLLFDLEALQRASEVVYVNKNLYHYRLNPKSTSWRIHREDDYSLFYERWETYINTYKNSDSRFRDGLQSRKAGHLAVLLKGYVFHPNNKEKIKDRKREYLRLREYYLEPMQNALKKNNVTFFRKILLLSVLYKWFWVSYLLCRLKRKWLIG